jgi:hypothetical protein
MDCNGTYCTVQYVVNSTYSSVCDMVKPLSTHSDGPVRFLIFCSISIFLLASLVAGRRLQLTAGTD